MTVQGALSFRLQVDRGNVLITLNVIRDDGETELTIETGAVRPPVIWNLVTQLASAACMADEQLPRMGS